MCVELILGESLILLAFIHVIGLKCSIRAISGTKTVDPVDAPKKGYEKQLPESWKIKMLYDGDCPLCMREVHALFLLC